MKIKWIGYVPDLDPATPGVITDCDYLIPTFRGMRGAPYPVTSGTSALAAKAYGAAVGVKLDGSYRVFAGTLTGLYEISGTSWSDVTRTVGGAYTTSANGRWRFAQFGNTALATNNADTLQYSNSGDFADVSGSPKAKCIDTVSGFVMLGATNEGTYGDQSDRWWCSAYNDYSDWTPAVTTQCTTGRLVDTPGAITGIKRIGSQVVAFKHNSMYLGTYAGPPAVWQWQLVPGDVGCLSQEAAVNIGNEIVFIGNADIYRFDGSRPVPIGDGIKEFFFSDLNTGYAQNIGAMHDFTNSLVYFYYPSTASSTGTIDSCIVYHYKTGKWGRDDRSIECPVEYLTGQITYANIADYFATYADITITYDSPLWNNSQPVPAIIDTTHTLKVLAGPCTAASLTSGEYGDEQAFSLLSRVKPRFKTAPTTCTMTNYYTDTSGTAFTTDQTVTMANGACDVLRSARWHKSKLDFTGDFEIIGADIQALPDGEE